jgi:hypothetical protein
LLRNDFKHITRNIRHVFFLFGSQGHRIA